MPNPNLNFMMKEMPSEGSIDAQIAEAKKGIQQAGEQIEQSIQKTAPTGKFSSAAVGRFVSIVQDAMSAFKSDFKIAKPTENLTVFPEDLTRGTMMISAAINDAISDAVLDPELAINPKDIIDDASLRAAGAKIQTAIKDRAFKKWLFETPPELEEAEGKTEGPEAEMEGEQEVPEKKASPPQGDVMSLFASRA